MKRNDFAGIAMSPRLAALVAQFDCGILRVGLKDSLFVNRSRLAASNAEQVQKICRIVEDLGSEIATPKKRVRRSA